MHTSADAGRAVLDVGALGANTGDSTSRSTQLGDVRKQNVALMMRTVLAHGPIARAGIASVTGMTSGAITKLTSVLSDAGLLREVPSLGLVGGSGRPRVPIAIDTERFRVLGIHIGYPRTTLCLLDLTGGLIREIRLPHESVQFADVVAKAVSAARTLIDDCDGELLAIGASTAGRVTTESGVVTEQPFFGWRDVPLRETLSQALQLPVAVDSNVRAMARAEHWFGAARGVDNFVQLFAGNVVAAAWVVGGQIVSGRHGMSGALEHLPLDDRSAERCRCGRRDCMQMITTDVALVSEAQRRGILTRQDGIDRLVRLARGGDEVAAEVMRRRASQVGAAASVLVDLLDPQLVVVSGAGLLNTPDFMAEVVGGARARMGEHHRHDLDGVLVETAFGTHAISVSAGSIALDDIYRDPLAFIRRP